MPSSNLQAVSTASETNAHHDSEHDHVLRPRPRKPQHPQVSELAREHSSNGSFFSGRDALVPPTDGTASGMTSGRSTPVAENAPESTKAIAQIRKQVRAEERRRRLFPSTNFQSRVSHFDPESDHHDFHGFFNLFWIGLAIMGMTSMLRNYKDTGFPFRKQIWTLFTIKLWHLVIADFLMVASTAVVVPLHRKCRKSRVGMTWTKGGMLIQSAYEVAWLSVWIAVPFVLQWTWTSQVFLLLHTMVLLMKMHSYMFYNGHLSEIERRLRALDRPSSPEASKAPASTYPTVENPMGGETHGEKSGNNSDDESNGIDNGNSNDSEEEDSLALLRDDLARELTSPMGNVTYPHNLTWANYTDYIVCPTLCYELEYPRTSSINLTNLFAKILAIFGCIFLLTIISEEFILPVLQESKARLEVTASLSESLLILAENISWLLFPFMLTFLLVFLVIFEYVLGACAELTRFADRHFYSDWWNSTDWMEFSREWNVPVYSFLRRHVYATSAPRIGRGFATVITFLISAVGHEIVMACITKKLRGYGFICQMMQLPIVMLQRTRWVRAHKTANNVLFWVSMIMGLSLICSLYVLI